MTDISSVEVPDGAVILIRDDGLAEKGIEDIATELHERFPASLVVLLPADSSFETMPLVELEHLLTALVAHKKAAEEHGIPADYAESAE